MKGLFKVLPSSIIFSRKVQYWQLIGIPPISSYCFYKDIFPPPNLLQLPILHLYGGRGGGRGRNSLLLSFHHSTISTLVLLWWLQLISEGVSFPAKNLLSSYWVGMLTRVHGNFFGCVCLFDVIPTIIYCTITSVKFQYHHEHLLVMYQRRNFIWWVVQNRKSMLEDLLRYHA